MKPDQIEPVNQAVPVLCGQFIGLLGPQHQIERIVGIKQPVGGMINLLAAKVP